MRERESERKREREREREKARDRNVERGIISDTESKYFSDIIQLNTIKYN